MTPAEQGFLLLTSRLGDPERRVLTAAQFRELTRRVQQTCPEETARELEPADLRNLGYGPEMAQQIFELLQEKARLERFLHRGKRAGCEPLSRITEGYPLALRKRLGLDSPGCIWCRGDVSILRHRAIALVGSRELRPDNARFAEAVGIQAARQGYVLVSGNARGADQTAQEACLRAGGTVISVVADCLEEKTLRENVLYISEDSFDFPFSSQRALSRNRIIHALAEKTFVAQCGYQTGGTWSGTVKNLRFGYSGVYCYEDGSPAHALLEDMGAVCISLAQLEDFSCLPRHNGSLFD